MASLALALALSVGAAGTARGERQTFRMYAGAQGLGAVGVRGLVEDAAGYLWSGGPGGLARFDGRRFRPPANPAALSHAEVRALLLDADGGLWVGTAAGLDRVRDGGVEPVLRGPAALGVDALAPGPEPGQVWLGTRAGLALWNGVHLEFVPELLGLAVPALHLRRDGALAVGTQDGAWLVRGRVTSRLGRLPPAADVRAFAEDRDGRLWVGYAHEVLRVEGDRFETVVRLGETLGHVSALHVDDAGALWIGCPQGLLRWWDDRLRVFGLRDGLRLADVTGLLTDRDGRIWAAGSGGLAAFVGRAFEIFDASDGLPSAYVRPILRDRRGVLYVGTLAGLSKWTGSGFAPVDPGQPMVGRYVLSMYEDPRGRLWLGTAAGLALRDEAGAWTARPFGTGVEAVGSIVGDEAGRVWVAQANVGILAIDGERVERLAPPGNPLGEPRLLRDRQGTLWVTGDAGLSVLRPGRWETWTAADGLAHAAPYHVAEDPRGALWFGYHAPAGLTRFDGLTHRTYTTQDGLPSDAVYDVGFDRRGALWVGTDRGAARWDGRGFVPYGPEEGFPSTECNAGGFFEDTDGRLWFATAEGLARYDHRLDRVALRPPEVSFESFRLGASLLSRDDAVVAAQDRDLEVRLGVLSYADPSRVALRARLLGSSERWLEVNDDRVVLPQLLPGEYRLEVEGRVAGLPWQAVAGRAFAITPPWWQRPSTLAGVVLLVLAVGAAAAWWRVRALAQRNLRLEALVRERTAVLEAQAATLLATDERLRRLNAELVEASRAKTQLVANVSHDLRTPLNGVLGMAELALAEPLSPHVRTYLETVRQSGRTLLELIDELLEFSRVEAGRLVLEPAPLALRAFLDETWAVLAAAARGKELDLRLYVAPEVPDHWLADARRLRRVLVNLVGNALKFTEQGGVQLEVTLDGAGRAPVLRFVVRDTGVGIPRDRLEAIFESFTQADGSTQRRFGGTGLGLAISRQLVELMGGRIEVESQEGVGSVFTFAVALERAAAEGPLERTSAVLAIVPAAAPLDVLVAEDNAVNQVVVRRMLERLGHRVHVVEDGAQAVARALERSFDVVLMDVQMPRVDGLEAAQQIRRMEPAGRRTPLLAVTANGMATDRAKSLAVGMDGHLTKPISIEALANALEPFVARAAARAAGR